MCVVLMGTASRAQENSQLEGAARSKRWLRLGHYLPAGNGYKSELDGRGYFFATDGATNPLAELRATIDAFHAGNPTGVFKSHPQCAFPERLRFLRETLNMNFPPISCPKFEEFLAMFHGPTAVSVIFSSAYPNNPASMFGHTFLKVKTSRKNDLLNMGINFSAFTPRDANMLLFIYQGVFGGYRGAWSADPYFTKVNEYINAESRDLWEYELSLTKEETLYLLAHLWELETNSHFEYFFFDENCSYQILRVIEAIKLDWDLTQHRIYVIPGETIKRLTDIPGVVARVHFRPSLFHQLQSRYDSLRPDDKAAFHQILSGNASGAERISPEVLDGALLSQLYKKATLKEKWSAVDQAEENKLLAIRAKNSAPARAVELPHHYYKTRPELGHDSYSFYLSGGYLDPSKSVAEGFGRMRVRSAYHDLLARDLGFAPYTEIEFPSLELQWFQDQIRLYDLGLLRITSLFPLNDFSHQWSWRLKAGAETLRGPECQGCLSPVLELGGGVALGQHSSRTYLLALLRGEAQHKLSLGHRLWGGIEGGFIANPWDKFKTRLVGRAFWSAPRHNRSVREHQFTWDHALSVGRNQEVRQNSSWFFSGSLDQSAWTEIQLMWVQYFR